MTAQHKDESLVFDVKTLADRLLCSQRHVWQMHKDGRIPGSVPTRHARALGPR